MSAPPTVDFNPYAPGYDADPFPVWDMLRTSPVHWWDAGRAWLVTRYADVMPLIRDTRLSPAFTEWEHAPPQRPPEEQNDFERIFHNGLFTMAHDDHVRVRKLAARAFRPGAIEAQRAAIGAIVDSCLAATGGDDTFDFAGDYAQRLPIKVISSLVNVPHRHEAVFEAFALGLIHGSEPQLTPEERAEAIAPVPAGVALLRELIEDRRGRPAEDFFGTLVRDGEDGERLTDWEILAVVGSLLAAGTDTTVHLLSFVMLNLLRRPDVMRRVREDRSLVRPLIHETLRHDHFGRIGLTRFALEDVELHGRTIGKGQMAYMMIGCAMRDPDVFQRPAEFDIDRDYDSNILFGPGPHFCIGAALARLEIEIALVAVLDRFPHIELAAEPTYGHHPMMREIASLPLRVSQPAAHQPGGCQAN